MTEFYFILFGTIIIFFIYLKICKYPDPLIFKESQLSRTDYKNTCKDCAFFSNNLIVCNKNNYGRCSFASLSRAVNGSSKPCKNFIK